MTQTLDSIARRRLVLAKQVYQRALALAHGAVSAVDGTLAVIEFDFALETIVKSVFRAFDQQHQMPESLTKLVGATNSLLQAQGYPPIAGAQNIHRVRDIRNAAQHEARTPTTDEVNECRTHTHDFLVQVFNAVWGRDFETLSVADFIQQPEVRTLLLEAESCVQKGDYLEAVQRSGAALTKALGCLNVAGMVAIPDSSLYVPLMSVMEAVNFIALGLNYAQYWRYKQVAGANYSDDSGTLHHSGGKEALERADAEYAVAYCDETILEIEGRVGNLDTPFGVRLRPPWEL